MHNRKFVFSQLLDFLDKDVFLRISNKYDGNRHVKSFTCRNQLAVLMFGQLSNRKSLFHFDATGDYVIVEQDGQLHIPSKIAKRYVRLNSTNVPSSHLRGRFWKFRCTYLPRFFEGMCTEAPSMDHLFAKSECHPNCDQMIDMMAFVQKKRRTERSIYEMLQLASISLTETLPLNKLFGKPNDNIVNELDESSEPTLL